MFKASTILKEYENYAGEILGLANNINFENSNDIPFIVFHSDAAQPTSNEIFTMMNINPRKIIIIDSDLLALEYVKLGLGAAFLRERQCFNDRDILDIISFDSLPLTTRIGFLNLKNIYISPLIQLFKNFCKERLNVFSQ